MIHFLETGPRERWPEEILRDDDKPLKELRTTVGYQVDDATQLEEDDASENFDQ